MLIRGTYLVTSKYCVCQVAKHTIRNSIDEVSSVGRLRLTNTHTFSLIIITTTYTLPNLGTPHHLKLSFPSPLFLLLLHYRNSIVHHLSFYLSDSLSRLSIPNIESTPPTHTYTYTYTCTYTCTHPLIPTHLHCLPTTPYTLAPIRPISHISHNYFSFSHIHAPNFLDCLGILAVNYPYDDQYPLNHSLSSVWARFGYLLFTTPSEPRGL
ncbi:hypothetical protein F5X96DRAFT_470791 [Biscogniauxia mediterranea]|nr:hypothetical protein F5X96DRAFT_470791 [Biscogniauxia mediterranea]